MKTVNGYEVIQVFESFSPKNLAMEGDKIGLQIGNLNRKVQNVMIALDVLEEVVDEAIQKDVQLIIAHHPPIFRPLAKITADNPTGRLIEKLIKHDIAVYAAHTNLDVAVGGVNDLLAEALGLKDAEVLVPTFEIGLKKLAVFVPKTHEHLVREAIGKVGAGSIGNYKYCSFTSNGTGRFLPGEHAKPYVGESGRLEDVEEVKIETIYPEHLEKKVLSAMIKAHPYEEVAYDLYRLDNKGETLGLGRVGYVDEISLRDFVEVLKTALEVKKVRVVGDLDAKVKKVAVLGGDGNKYFPNAIYKGADVYVTGDFYYHTAHDAAAQGLNVIDPGHNIEKVMKKGVAKTLTQAFLEREYEINVFPSEIDTDPFQFV
ncbi:Nif3-like dinuclear metal center hexameric protein [Bacillus sp. CGMCC 1.16607]|uniref:Nif3-like dinuclear metal center hexameric protein n=1 Tax=Bacillus sp. CGMCC 1.16607 TaxID=3351842 RepID=UPI003634825B